MNKITSAPRPEWLHRRQRDGLYCYGPPDSSHRYNHVHIDLMEDGSWGCVGPRRSDGGYDEKETRGSLYVEVLLLAHEMLLEERK